MTGDKQAQKLQDHTSPTPLAAGVFRSLMKTNTQIDSHKEGSVSNDRPRIID